MTEPLKTFEIKTFATCYRKYEVLARDEDHALGLFCADPQRGVLLLDVYDDLEDIDVIREIPDVKK
jgi:hypothetical protein